ncbi:multicomponent Na+:H+ antiporter subunit E [Rhodovulum sp. ES.010]|uniref:Na+/H+ antiporter subunit E n=1 Tax=Rhodovulum sp. ES.010 TaxID=1882821 RepID=UPI000926512A|nr:Na+/H+ antiporter subunit E [Rhodovulum sp. ES.010]SIO54722.1 multicomponent Na+:H+ antiporter subunit E [Rhodovulum sp. ES.010]
MREPDRLRRAEDMPTAIRDARDVVSSTPVLPFTARPQEAVPAMADPDGMPDRTGSRGWRKLFLTAGTLALIWGMLTGSDLASWVFGGPAVATATALAMSFPAAPAWRLSIKGALDFVVWFAVASARGSVDVAGRALAWRMPLAPGFRSYETDLPPGAARLVFVNAITLLPGTLSAEIVDDRIEVHMLDKHSDLEAELAPLEARVRALFALPDVPTDSRNLTETAK